MPMSTDSSAQGDIPTFQSGAVPVGPCRLLVRMHLVCPVRKLFPRATSLNFTICSYLLHAVQPACDPEDFHDALADLFSHSVIAIVPTVESFQGFYPYTFQKPNQDT